MFLSRSVFFLAFATMFLVSCQKEVDDALPVPGNTSDSYQPLSAGSWWKYKDSATGTFSTSTATNVTKNVGGIPYTVIVAGANADSTLQAQVGPDYYMRAIGYSPNTGAPYDILFHYLKEAPVGTNWSYTAGQGNGFTAFMETTILEKDITVTVAGKTYPNVYHTQMEFSYDIMGSIMDAGTYDFYIAKGVGIIRVRARIGFFGVFQESATELVDHH
ncbi:MAG TPA: hypothetical protein VFZ78_00825, partial [Flavisolibacter sp.]